MYKVRKLELCNKHPFYTPKEWCENPEHTTVRTVFVLQDSDGFKMRNSAGDVALWNSYSGAYKALRRMF